MADNETQELEAEETPSAITPSDIADATGADPKTVRAYLRSNHGRPANMKGKSWNIPADVAEQVIAHFSETEEDEDEESGDSSDES